MDKIIVKLIDIDFVKQNMQEILSMLDDKRIEKANGYLKENDKLLSLGGGYLYQKYLPVKDFKYNENGKPYLENGPFFNLSHSGEYIALVISKTREVGIDIQKVDENRLKTIEYVSNQKSNPNEMFQIWSNKESLIKCLGLNMSEIKNVPGLPLTGEREFKGDLFYTQSMIYDGYSLSVTLKGIQPLEIKIQKEKKA